MRRVEKVIARNRYTSSASAFWENRREYAGLLVVFYVVMTLRHLRFQEGCKWIDYSHSPLFFLTIG
jgi:hypothetical protein